jgi:hypothetical protein
MAQAYDNPIQASYPSDRLQSWVQEVQSAQTHVDAQRILAIAEYVQAQAQSPHYNDQNSNNFDHPPPTTVETPSYPSTNTESYAQPQSPEAMARATSTTPSLTRNSTPQQLTSQIPSLDPSLVRFPRVPNTTSLSSTDPALDLIPSLDPTPAGSYRAPSTSGLHPTNPILGPLPSLTPTPAQSNQARSDTGSGSPLGPIPSLSPTPEPPGRVQNTTEMSSSSSAIDGMLSLDPSLAEFDRALSTTSSGSGNPELGSIPSLDPNPVASDRAQSTPSSGCMLGPILSLSPTPVRLNRAPSMDPAADLLSPAGSEGVPNLTGPTSTNPYIDPMIPNTPVKEALTEPDTANSLGKGVTLAEGTKGNVDSTHDADMSSAQSPPVPAADDPYPGLPCMDCGEDSGHTWDCNIGSKLTCVCKLSTTANNVTDLVPMENLTILDYRNLADSVERFDPGPWTTHQGPPPEPEPEDPAVRTREMAAVIRNEESYRNNPALHLLPDDIMITFWGLTTSAEQVYPSTGASNDD